MAGSKEQTVNEMMTLGITKEEAEGCLASLDNFRKYVNLLHGHDNHGILHIMSKEDYEMLEKVYKDALEKHAKVYESILLFRSARGASAPKMPEYVSKTYLNLMKEYHIVRDLCEAKAEEPLEVARYRITEKMLQGSFENNETLSGATSSRFVMQVKDANGNIRTGLFTKKLIRPEVVSPEVSSLAMVSLNSQLGLIHGERLDSRNSAMSDVAEMLGRKDLLAHSEDLKVECNGTTVEGSFMDFVEGTDPAHYSMQKDKLFFDMNMDPSKPFCTKKAVKDILDLQVIDIICQNLDRHSGNMIYQYKQTADGVKLDGIVGIDNDTSFGNKKLEYDESYNRLPSMNHTVIVTEKMAEYIMSITPNMMLGTLSKYKIAEKGKRNTVERLLEMQERIKRGMAFSNSLKEEPLSAIGKEFLKDPIGKVDDVLVNPNPLKEIIVVVPDKLLDQVNIREIGEKSTENDPIFGSNQYYGVCKMVAFRHTRQSQSLVRSMASNEAKKLQFNHMPLIEKIKDTKIMLRNFAKWMKESFIQVQERVPKNEDLKILHHEIIGQMARIEKKSRTLGDEAHVLKNNDLNSLSLACRDLKRKCVAFSLKFSELKANKKWLFSADKNALASIESINGDVKLMMDEIWARDDMDLLNHNVKLAKEIDSIEIQDARRRIMPEITDQKAYILGQITNHPNDFNRKDLAVSISKLMYVNALNNNMEKFGAERVNALVSEINYKNNLKKVTDLVSEYMDELPSNEAICNMLKPENFEEGFVAGFKLYANLVKESKKNQTEINTDVEVKLPEKKKTLRDKRMEETLENAFPGLGIR